MTSSPAVRAAAMHRLEGGHAGRPATLEERHLGLDHRHHPGEGLHAAQAERAEPVGRSSGSPHCSSRAADGSMPAHSGPVPATAAATLAREPGRRSSGSAMGHSSSVRRTRRTPWRQHQRSISRRIRTGARGSRKVAVPTWTASAPAMSSSTASSPVITPPTPMMAASGWAARTSNTARTATGWMAGPDSPPPAGPDPRTGRRRSTSMAMASTVLIRVTASAPAPRAAPATSARSATVGLSLAHRGSPGSARPPRPPPRRWPSASGRTSGAGPRRWGSSR